MWRQKPRFHMVPMFCSVKHHKHVLLTGSAGFATSVADGKTFKTPL